MTNTEAKKILESYIACESKKAHFECSEYNCDDSCPLLYEMGTVGEFNEAINMGIKALEQEPCEDAISRQAVLEIQAKYAEHMGATKFWQMRDDIKTLSSVKPQERTGEWIENAPEYQNIDPPYICSECGNFHLRKTNYCDQCGARMEV